MVKRLWFHTVTLGKLSGLAIRCGFSLKAMKTQMDQELIEAKAKLAKKWRRDG